MQVTRYPEAGGEDDGEGAQVHDSVSLQRGIRWSIGSLFPITAAAKGLHEIFV